MGFGQRLEPGARDECEPRFEALVQLARVELKIGMDLQRQERARRWLDPAGQIQLFYDVEQRDVVRLLIEAGGAGQGQHVAARHGQGSSMSPRGLRTLSGDRLRVV